MGMDQSTYLGPMARFRKVTSERDETCFGCEKHKTRFEMTAFCGYCGGRHTEYILKVKAPHVDVHVATASIDAALMVIRGEGFPETEWDTYIPNVNLDGLRDGLNTLRE